MKSHVTLEQHLCLVCGKTFDTGTLLMDRRLRPTFDHYTVTEYDLCPEHKKLHEEGYVALVAVDETKSKTTYGRNNKPTIQPEDAYRTGGVAHVRRTVWDALFNTAAPEGPMCYVEEGVITALQSKADEAQAQQDG